MPGEYNQLAKSKSPYLLQHAQNPVNWYPWGELALDRAQKENKPILVSIGYSACHWCHVMEHESFEDKETAELMNANFVCIKIDREERPDLDNIYMDAIQTMGLNGGWPLNVFLMPNQKPFYGGTYFPNPKWKVLLKNIADAYKTHPGQLADSAEGFGRSIATSEIHKYGLVMDFSSLQNSEISEIAGKLSSKIDQTWGGMDKVPKFPMPSIWEFLLDFAQLQKDKVLEESVLFTLKKIGMGGIYDHLRGGFSRYSVDGEWFAPHFEKMLYDNGQLLSLYAKAFAINKDQFYKEKVSETVDWLQAEMLDQHGGLYAALDADSEGEEGKFYTWTFPELESVLSIEELRMLTVLYNLEKAGNWENGVNILFQTKNYSEIIEILAMDPVLFQDKLLTVKEKLLQKREERIRPGLDDKILSGWNGLTISGLTQAFLLTGNKKAFKLAIDCGEFIRAHMIRDRQLFRSFKDGTSYTPGFLEDYAGVVQGFMDLYQVSYEEKWLNEAKSIIEYCLENFWDEKDGFFYFNNPGAEKLIADKKEIFDNVIPASNSIMARNMHRLGLYFYEEKYLELSKKLLASIRKLIVQEPGYLSNWARLYLEQLVPTAEIAIIGRGAINTARELNQKKWTNLVIAASEESSNLPLLHYKEPDTEGNALIYVCFDKACQKPVKEIEEALAQLPTLV